jgi:hypothetical protein
MTFRFVSIDSLETGADAPSFLLYRFASRPASHACSQPPLPILQSRVSCSSSVSQSHHDFSHVQTRPESHLSADSTSCRAAADARDRLALLGDQTLLASRQSHRRELEEGQREAWSGSEGFNQVDCKGGRGREGNEREGVEGARRIRAS